MISPEKLAANRANASRSTGPRTVSGKAKSRINAVRHGLRSGGPLGSEAEATVRALEAAFVRAGSAPSPALRVLAEAQFHLEQVRRFKRQALDSAIAAAVLTAPPQSTPEQIRALGWAAAAAECLKLEGYERKAFSRWRRALKAL